jgi:hypothetical protein
MFRDLMPSSFFARLRVFSAMPSAAGGCSPSLSPESVVHTRISRLLEQVWSRDNGISGMDVAMFDPDQFIAQKFFVRSEALLMPIKSTFWPS